MYESEDENYLRMAQRELDLGYFESAISFYDKAIKCSPNADNYYLKGLAYYNHCTKNYLDYSEASDIKSAIQNFSTAISIAPQNAIYYYYRARANLKYIQNYDYIEVDGDRGSTHDYKLKGDALSFILTDLQKAMNLDSAYEDEYKRFYNSNVEQKYVLEDSSIPKKYQLNLKKKPIDKTTENPMDVLAKNQPNFENNKNEQFLEAILTNNTNIVKTFIENGANVNLIDESTGMSVLMLAVKKHNYKLCEFLLDNGADLFLKNNIGETIFDVFKEDSKLICWLEAQNKRLKNQKFKDAALKGDISYITEHFSEVNTDTVSWSFVHTPSILVLDYFLNKGIDINVKSIFLQKYGYVGKYEYALTSLMQGCQQNNFDKAKWLLEHGAKADITCQYIRVVHYKDDNIDDRRELSALDYARASKNQEMIDLLQSYLNNSIIHQDSQLNLNKDSNSRLSENETKEYPRQLKFFPTNFDKVKELNKNPNNNGYKILKYNEDTGICIIRDKYLNYGLSDKDFNIILPAEYMDISFCKDGDTNILLEKKDENGTPKYGIANKEGKIIIEPIYGYIRYNKAKDKYVLISDTFNPDEKILADINTGLIENSNMNNNENFSINFENIKQKADFEKFLDETIEQAKNKVYSEFLIDELTKIKEIVIKQRHYKGWKKEKISESIANRFSLSTFLVKERDGCNDEWTNRLWNIIVGAANYEQLPEKIENADANKIKDYSVEEDFDYKAFAADLSQQANKLLPEEIQGEDRTYIIEKIEEFAKAAGESLVNNEDINYTTDECEFITQVIAEWTFHKSIDLIKGGIDGENRDFVLQKIAFTIFEVIKECFKREVEQQTIVDAVEYHVNKVYQETLKDLYSNSDITLETYNRAIKYSNIDDMANECNEDHGSFYSTDEKTDSNYLKDKMLYMYGKELAYKYLVKAAHVLKKHNCNKKDRQKILKYLYGCSEYYIDSALHVEFEFKKPEMERLITVGMEVAFHRIVVMYKNNILNNPTMAEDIIDTFASIVCAVEINYIKDKDKLKDEYYIANTIYFRELKEHLKEWLDEGKITKEQYNHALDKSGLVYLTPELTRLMKAKGFHIGRIGYMTIFIVVWIIFKLIIFYTKHH